MPVKIQKRLQVLSLIERSKEDFKKELEATIPPEVIKTIDAGNNPIKAGKPVKYSDSYLEQITGKKVIRYTDKNGKEKIKYGKDKKTRDSSTGANTPIGGGRTTNSLQSRYGKLKSPVNLKLTGELHASIDTRKTKDGIEVYFKDEKAEWHNEGVQENNLPARRLLPNKQGEEFNRNIFNRIKEALQNALRKNLK